MLKYRYYCLARKYFLLLKKANLFFLLLPFVVSTSATCFPYTDFVFFFNVSHVVFINSYVTEDGLELQTPLLKCQLLGVQV